MISLHKYSLALLGDLTLTMSLIPLAQFLCFVASYYKSTNQSEKNGKVMAVTFSLLHSK